MYRPKYSIALGFVFVLLLAGCAFNFGFKPTPGGDPEYDGKKLSVTNFQSIAPLAPSTFGQSFTESLRDIFITQSKVTLVKDRGDVALEGSITGYNVKPVAITSNETAANNRLTITIKVSCVNNVKPKESFEQTFSRFADFDGTQDLSQVEDELIEEITEQLVQDIFNQTFGDW